MKKQTRLVLVIAILLQIMSYFMPFLMRDTGYYFFSKGVDALFNDGIRWDNWHLYFAFFSPIIFFPIALILSSKTLSIRATKVWRGILFVFFVIPVFVTVGLVIERGVDLDERGLLGYLMWSVSILSVYVVFWYNGQDKITEEDAITKHLIDDN
ncbi:hypothetical protein [Aureispira anguillae]|uniref:Uncharacterized protein n=1 Tax=Aureispira anguillae TaxID=2864201 RepID=A0A916DTW4_9BACT|nr:hypothetical protein [Aureispira anguillae]BDS13614.1 hypothetical protein AsAng_0043530 [Aureispira anguillae]